MKQKTPLLLKIILLMGLVIFPQADAHACTPSPSPSATASYTPTATATDVPPGVTPAPSLTPTPSDTPGPPITVADLLYGRNAVVFRGTVLAVENRGNYDESVLVRVQEYFRGEGGAVVRIINVSSYRLCHGVVGEPGYEAIFYVKPHLLRAQEFYPDGVLSYAPQDVVGTSPNGTQISFGWLETATLGLSALGGALILAWMVRPGR
jgi:hypothetical protein